MNTVAEKANAAAEGEDLSPDNRVRVPKRVGARFNHDVDRSVHLQSGHW